MAAPNLLLLLLIATCTLSHEALGLGIQDVELNDVKNDWPCPESADIAPCECIRNGESLELDCSAVQSDAELEAAFKAHFPFNNFTMLTIISNPGEKRIPIKTLNDNVFQNLTFEIIRISNTELFLVYDKTFDKSLHTLKELVLSDSHIMYFPFDLVNSAPLLENLRLFRNKLIHMPEMTSNSLKYLSISYNPGLQFPDHAFEELPNLETLVANDIELTHVAPGIFKNNVKLTYVDLSYNKLETLYQGSLVFQSPIKELRLNDNRLSYIEQGAISGLGKGEYTILMMHRNSLKHIEQDVWEPAFESVRGKIRTFVFDGNPLICQCDILWLVKDSDHRDTIAHGVFCSDTETDIHDVDVGFLEENCK